MTNLAFKGILGVKVMAEISRVVKAESDAQTYDVRCCRLCYVDPLELAFFAHRLV